MFEHKREKKFKEVVHNFHMIHARQDSLLFISQYERRMEALPFHSVPPVTSKIHITCFQAAGFIHDFEPDSQRPLPFTVIQSHFITREFSLHLLHSPSTNLEIVVVKYVPRGPISLGLDYVDLEREGYSTIAAFKQFIEPCKVLLQQNSRLVC